MRSSIKFGTIAALVTLVVLTVLSMMSATTTALRVADNTVSKRAAKNVEAAEAKEEPVEALYPRCRSGYQWCGDRCCRNCYHGECRDGGGGGGGDGGGGGGGGGGRSGH